MIELTWVGEALRWAGWIYWLLAIGALALAVTKIKPMAGKVIGVVVVLVLFGYLPVTTALENKKIADARKAAWAHFEMRCKGAGEKIHRTVENVEGILLIKVRPDKINYSNQFELDDPYGRDFGGDAYIESFLSGRNDQGQHVSGFGSRLGFRYVDANDPKDNQRYRYTLSLREIGKKDPAYVQKERQKDPGFSDSITDFTILKQPAPAKVLRYGVIFEDISTSEDRKIWIAGSSLRVIDLQTNEIIAERVGFMIDRAQGNQSGGRSPWLYAAFDACPRFPLMPKSGQPEQMYQTRNFVEKTLIPKQGK